MNDDILQDFNKLDTNQENKGVFIINEGNFMYGNASLSYYNPETKEIQNNVFYNTNALPLGDVAQSMTIKDSLGYIVINNSGKIYIININTFKYTDKITDLISPRYIFFNDNQKAYISDLYSKKVSVYDIFSKTIIKEIDINNGNTEFTQHTSEMFVKTNSKIYVNSWSYDNTILIIDAENDILTDSIKVGKQPNSMIIDKFNNLWVLCDGGFSGSSYGQENAKLIKIDTQKNSIITEYIFDNISVSPSHLCTNLTKDSLYFIYNSWSGNVQQKGIYKMSVLSGNLPQNPFISIETQNVYGLGINPHNGDIYFSDAINYSQNGVVYRFKSDATPVDTFKVGINPSGFCFKSNPRN